MRKVFCTLLATLLLSANLFSSCPSCGRSEVYRNIDHFEVTLPEEWNQFLLFSDFESIHERWVYTPLLPNQELILFAKSEELELCKEAQEKTTITTLVRDLLDLDFDEVADGESPFYSHWEILEQSETEAIVRAYDDEHDVLFILARIVLTPSGYHMIGYDYAGDDLLSTGEGQVMIDEGQTALIDFLKEVPIISP